MSLWFEDEKSQEIFFSLRGLTNKNNGFYKSFKQAQYLNKVYNNIVTDVDEVKTNFGVTVEAGQRTVRLTGMTRWADYGSRSVVPLIYYFVLDDVGVVALYRIGGNGNLRDGWRPDTNKVKTVWVRPEDAVCPFTVPTAEEVAAQKAAEPVSDWLGLEGDAVTVEAELVRFRDLGIGRFGPMQISVLRDGLGNIINVWRNLCLQPGQKVQLAGRIKSCDEYNGTKQTTLIRVKTTPV